MNKLMISLCDYTGIMARPWAEAGFKTFCVDTQHQIRKPKIKKVGAGEINFVWGDVRNWIPPEGKMCFGAVFPPCTHIASSGSTDFRKKGLPSLCDALELFNACQLICGWSRAPFMIENPVGVLSSHARKPDHLFDPYEYGG